MSTDTTDGHGRVYRWVAHVLGRRFGRGPVGRRLREWYAGIHPRYRPVTVGVWAMVLAFYALGDTGLTTVVLSLGGFEASPVARVFLDHLGYAGLVVQKTAAIGLLALLWRYYPTVGGLSADPWRLVVPTVAAARGVQLVALHVHNIVVLL